MAGKTKSVFQIFKNQQVRVLLKMSVTSGTKNVPYSVTGYLLGETKEEYLFGDLPHEVSFAVKKDLVGLTEIVKKTQDQYEDMLDELDVPKDSTGMN